VVHGRAGNILTVLAGPGTAGTFRKASCPVTERGVLGRRILEKQKEIERYSDAYASISGSSLDEPSSKKRILQAARELKP
jgi:hypothetical protein